MPENLLSVRKMDRSARYRAALFDLDGTLVNTTPDLVNALDALRVSRGIDLPLPRLTWESWVSRGAAALIQAGLGDYLSEPLEDSMAFFLDYYGRHLYVDSFVYPGIVDVLVACRSRGMKLAVVTNKRHDLANQLLTECGLIEYFDVVVGGGTVPVSKPEPAPLIFACDALGVASQTCVMVGDDERDLVAAERAGVPAILATWGLGAAAVDSSLRTTVTECLAPDQLPSYLLCL